MSTELQGVYQLRQAKVWQHKDRAAETTPLIPHGSPASPSRRSSTVRHSADLGYIPVVVRDACDAGDQEAAARALETLVFAGDAIIATTAEVCAALSASGRT